MEVSWWHFLIIFLINHSIRLRLGCWKVSFSKSLGLIKSIDFECKHQQELLITNSNVVWQNKNVKTMFQEGREEVGGANKTYKCSIQHGS